MSDLVNDLGNVVLENEKAVFGETNRKSKQNTCMKSKPWFNKECKERRSEFHEARNQYKKSKTASNKADMNLKAKTYRKVLNTCYKKYTDKCASELRSLSKNDTKSFWKTLHKFSSKKRDAPNVDLETLYEYVNKLNAGDDELENLNIDVDVICNNEVFDEILNGEISELEIQDAIRSLKNNKVPGADKIVNEYLKYSSPQLLSIYCTLYNLVLNSGIIPESWTSGINKPVYKNNGSPLDPDNFRAITLVSCLGKLFTCILNTRFNLFSNELNVISENQAGFRRGYSTMDNIFVLHSLIELYFSFGKKLYCTFVDFRKAFDTVWMDGLWLKLQNSEIKGKCFGVIYNMYQGIKSCVQYGGNQSDFLPCLTGVRQGENVFPFYSPFFLNDLENYFSQLNGLPLETIQEKLENEIHIFCNFFVILYANDTIILSESKENMQNSLDIFHSYCEMWNLRVNANKTKVMIFSKRKVR